MKIMINYDLVHRIKDAREKFGPLKIIRNRKKSWTIVQIPLWLFFSITGHYTALQSIMHFINVFGILLFMNYVPMKLAGLDLYGAIAERDLKTLVPKLQDACIHTEYDMLLNSEVYDRKYKIKFNKNKLPQILESKYILVPTHGFDGNETETSVLQEHVIGTRNYELSIGSPEKKKSLSLRKLPAMNAFNR